MVPVGLLSFATSVCGDVSGIPGSLLPSCCLSPQCKSILLFPTQKKVHCCSVCALRLALSLLDSSSSRTHISEVRKKRIDGAVLWIAVRVCSPQLPDMPLVRLAFCDSGCYTGRQRQLHWCCLPVGIPYHLHFYPDKANKLKMAGLVLLVFALFLTVVYMSMQQFTPDLGKYLSGTSA
ncbi:hypothetical protein CRG98_038757 [Punica granatum]|uniref:Uncharacterized protein n=1 Tax=Punica granatum TaxID=22663 RepID=A0A2I0IB06_PUNGR|nr:hypothetical protein CRG98_038757 [Punica granatum]